MSISVEEYRKLLIEGEDAFRTIASDLNSISFAHIYFDQEYRTYKTWCDIVVALALYKRSLQQ